MEMNCTCSTRWCISQLTTTKKCKSKPSLCIKSRDSRDQPESFLRFLPLKTRRPRRNQKRKRSLPSNRTTITTLSLSPSNSTKLKKWTKRTASRARLLRLILSTSLVSLVLWGISLGTFSFVNPVEVFLIVSQFQEKGASAGFSGIADVLDELSYKVTPTSLNKYASSCFDWRFLMN